MALTITPAIQNDGPVNAAVHVVGYADALGDPEPVVALDVSELSPAAARVRVNKMAWSVSGGTVILSWATATGREPFAYLTGQGEADYCHSGGLLYRGDDGAGDILVSTDGFNLGSTFTLDLEMRKKG